MGPFSLLFFFSISAHALKSCVCFITFILFYFICFFFTLLFDVVVSVSGVCKLAAPKCRFDLKFF